LHRSKKSWDSMAARPPWNDEVRRHAGVQAMTVNTANNPTTGDTMTLTPSAVTAFFINAGLPAAPTTSGDSLTLNLVGVTTPAVTETGPGSGCWTFGNRQGVTYTGIEAQWAAGTAAPFLLGPLGTVNTPQPAFHWVGTTGASRYEIVVADITDPAAPQTVLHDANVTGTSRTAATTLLASHRYRWAVRAFDRLGNPGSWSSPLEFTVNGLVS
jgi:hypothetical protein